MNSRAIEAAWLTGVAILITVAIAAPVLRAPSERIFGMPTVGHHHDPFTFMQRIDRPVSVDPYLQPATDLPGALAARVAGPVAAYNWLVLLTFPLSALAAFLLARYLSIAPLWAGIAAVLFAFSPFHLSQAAYHPHIAQTHWIPLYLLVLWRCLDNPTRGAVIALVFTVAGVTLSNFYGGLIAAVITLPAAGAYWLLVTRRSPNAFRGLAVTSACLAVIAMAGASYVWNIAGSLSATPVIDPVDLVRYGAHWWSYVMPPVAHPLVGPAVRDLWHTAGVDAGLLEQQVTLGWGVIALAATAIAATIRGQSRAAVGAFVPVLVSVAALAFLFSLGGGVPTLLHQFIPVFRSYARFGVVVQLMLVLLAAIGAQQLWGSGMRHARAVCAALLVLAAAEYMVWPPSMSRAALPTRAHHWVAGRADRLRVLDCVPPADDTAAIQWLTRHQVAAYGEPFLDCGEPNLADKLAAAGYTHILVRGRSPEADWLARGRVPSGLQTAAHFEDSDLFAVGAIPPPVHTASMTRFHPRERDRSWTWRWMEDEASWTVANRQPELVAARLEIEMMAFGSTRELTVFLDGEEVQSVMVGIERAITTLGPFVLTPGDHQLTFRAGPSQAARASMTNEADSRPLSFRMGGWRWVAGERQP